MFLTERDTKLLKDMALSHVLSRDQIIKLGYFTSVSRANTRLRALRDLRLVRKIETPFFSQSLYVVDKAGIHVLGDRIATIVKARGASPRFLQHALYVTNTRLALLAKGATAWKFEQQLRVCSVFGGREYQVRPDGLAVFGQRIVALEVDLGHVAPAKFREKLRSFDTFVTSGDCERHWGQPTFKLLALTTGKLRANRLARLVPQDARFEFAAVSFDQFGVPAVGAWS